MGMAAGHEHHRPWPPPVWSPEPLGETMSIKRITINGVFVIALLLSAMPAHAALQPVPVAAAVSASIQARLLTAPAADWSAWSYSPLLSVHNNASKDLPAGY